MPTIRLTKSAVESLPLADKGNQLFFHDETLKGFGLRINTQTKSYFVQAAVKGRSVRTTVGKHGVITTEQARQQARQILAEMYSGKNPNREKQEKRAKLITLQESLDQYLSFKKAKLKPRSIEEYNYYITHYLQDWLKRPIKEISKEMVVKRYNKIGTQNGKAVANNTMRSLRAMYNYSRSLDSTMPENPVLHLSHTRTWFTIKRRKTYIMPNQIKPWFMAVMELDNECTRDYLLVLLFTGMRRNEAAKLQWKDIDFSNKRITVHDTKNGDALELPLSNYLYEMLNYRHQNSNPFSPYVFPSSGKKGYIQEVRRNIWKVKEKSGVSFILHDLRRTFITIAESLDIPHYSLKYLLNHRTDSDVTGGYPPDMQKIATEMVLKQAELIAAELGSN